VARHTTIRGGTLLPYLCIGASVRSSRNLPPASAGLIRGASGASDQGAASHKRRSDGLSTIHGNLMSSARGSRWRVLIVDDHDDFRRVLRLLLVDYGYEVVGEAASAEAGIAATVELRPDLVLLDVSLPDGSGIDAARRITTLRLRSRVLLISSDHDVKFESAARDSGAIGFLPKAQISAARLDALRRV
jgi:CheY-like chemotaxis protein